MLFISLPRASSLASILCVLVFTGSGIVNPVGQTIVTNRKFRNLENVEEIDWNAQRMENRVLFLKMKDKMQKDEILMPKSKAPSKKEDSLSLPNHIGSSNNLA